ncbi:hypothetical protein CEXT_325841 [Caerostris extrusa]|uniref:Uncharacterized protein n=1 Tax=Caerostris extrusa TaxID=172846 RepID=A0AAV4SAE9_CAEEX|nr:hypothetical protein CEXT_325841 [Caerostris extrusa]
MLKEDKEESKARIVFCVIEHNKHAVILKGHRRQRPQGKHPSSLPHRSLCEGTKTLLSGDKAPHSKDDNSKIEWRKSSSNTMENLTKEIVEGSDAGIRTNLNAKLSRIFRPG